MSIQNTPPSKVTLTTANSQESADTESYDTLTPNSYDSHIIPAETAARKEREGKHFKHLSTHPEGPKHISTSSGFTVDKEGLIDNFSIEPEIYYDKTGDLQS